MKHQPHHGGCRDDITLIGDHTVGMFNIKGMELVSVSGCPTPSRYLGYILAMETNWAMIWCRYLEMALGCVPQVKLQVDLFPEGWRTRNPTMS